MRDSSWWATAVSGLVAVAALAGLVAVAMLAVPGLLIPAQERAYRADLAFLERAVDVHGVEGESGAGRPWPTTDGAVGAPEEGETPGWQCDGGDMGEVCSWIDFAALEARGHIDGDRVASADPKRNTTATGGATGSYGWYIDSDGAVRSVPPFSLEVGYP